MKKFGTLAAIASGIGGYVVLAVLSSSPSWFGDSKNEDAVEKKSPATLEVSVNSETNSGSSPVIVREPQGDGERS